MGNDDPDGPYCDRCKVATKASEWKYIPADLVKFPSSRDSFMHVLILDEQGICGWKTTIPRKVK